MVLTTQAGKGRVLYCVEQFNEIIRWMCVRFDAAGASFAAVYFCPFHSEQELGMYRKKPYDRKPNPGMILRARGEIGLDLSLSILVGDKGSVIMVAMASGVGFTVLWGEDLESTIRTKAISLLFDVCAILKRNTIWP